MPSRVASFGAACCLVAWTAAVAVAEENPHLAHVPAESRIDWTTPKTGVIGRTTVGDIGSGSGLSAVVIRGGRASCVLSPASHGAMWLIDGVATDAAFVAGIGPAGTDVLAVVSPTGLVLKTYDPDAPDRFSVESVAAAGWVDAQLVRAGDLDGDGDADLIGVGVDRRTVLTLYNDGANGWLSGASFQVQSDRVVRDLAVIGWTGATPREIAVCSTWGTEIFDPSGVRLWWRRSYQTDNLIAVVREVGGPSPSLERIAMVYRTLNGAKQTVAIADAAGDEDDVTLHVAGAAQLDVVGVAAGDVDGDGDDDLLLAHRSDHDLRLLYNLRGAQSGGSFATEPSFAYAPGTIGVTDAVTIGVPGVAMIENQAVPVLDDLDGDGMADLFCPVYDADYLVYFAGSEGAPPQSPAPGGSHPVWIVATLWTSTSTGPGVQIDIEVADDWGVVGTALDDLEVVLWYEPVGGPISSVAEGHFVFVDPAPLAGTSTRVLSIVLPRHPVPAPDGFDDRYYVEVRPVDWSGTAVLASKENYPAGFTGEPQEAANVIGPSLQYLLDLPGAWPSSILVVTEDNSGGPILGGFVPQIRIPPLNPGQPPVIRPPTPVTGSGPVVATPPS